MAKSSPKRVARRLTAKNPQPRRNHAAENHALADSFPEPEFGTVAKGVKIAHITTAQQGEGFTTLGLGKDGKVYCWNPYLGGWVLNIMSQAEKDRLKIFLAVQAKLKAENQNGAQTADSRRPTPEELAELDAAAKRNGAKQNPVAEALKKNPDIDVMA